MDFREVMNYYFYNDTNTTQKASFTKGKPEILKSNLSKKEARIQRFYVNNTKLAQFIPDRVYYETKNYLTQTTNASVSTISVNNTLNVNSLEYYVVLRDTNNNYSVIVYLQHVPINTGINPPSSPISSDFDYYNNTYYYYYDFTHFLTIFVNAFQTAWLNHPLHGTPNANIDPIMWQNNKFQFFVQNQSLWYFEISPSLQRLFPFKSVLTSDNTYRLVFDTTPASINGSNYYEIDADFYDTIFPYQELVFISDNSQLNPVKFLNGNVLNSNTQDAKPEYAILTFNISTNNFSQVYNFFYYVNEQDTNWVNFDSNIFIDRNITISLFLRLKQNILIPYILNTKELCSFNLEIKYKA